MPITILKYKAYFFKNILLSLRFNRDKSDTQVTTETYKLQNHHISGVIILCKIINSDALLI